MTINIIGKNIYENLDYLPLDLQGWNGNSPIFEELIKSYKPSIIIEVGTWKGQSAINMGNIVKNLKLDCQIYCVDTWLGALEFWTEPWVERDLKLKNGYPQIYYQFLNNVKHSNLQDIINPLPMTSLIAARYFRHKNIKAQIIYIDGSHEIDDVYLDIKYYYELLTDNGVIFGDDILWNQVKHDVEKFTKDYNLNYAVDNDFWKITK